MALRHVWVETTMFDHEDDRKETETDIMWLLEALCQRNQDYLRQRPNTPRLYKSGVVWKRPAQFNGDIEEVVTLKKALGLAANRGDVRQVLRKIQDVLGGEHFCDIGVILENGGIDCDGLACWRVAELRQAGIPAHPMMTSRERPDGSEGVIYHAIVRWPPFGDHISGNPYEETDEDPSLLLGMSQPQRKLERDEEIRKNLERIDYIRRCKQRGIRPGAAVNLQTALEDVLGLRRNMSPVLEQQLEQLLRSAA